MQGKTKSVKGEQWVCTRMTDDGRDKTRASKRDRQDTCNVNTSAKLLINGMMGLMTQPANPRLSAKEGEQIAHRAELASRLDGLSCLSDQAAQFMAKVSTSALAFLHSKQLHACACLPPKPPPSY